MILRNDKDQHTPKHRHVVNQDSRVSLAQSDMGQTRGVVQKNDLSIKRSKLIYIYILHKYTRRLIYAI